MFKKWGIIGIILIILSQINFFLTIQPFADWYFPIIWIGYILIIDAVIYNINKKSLVNNHFFHFIGLFILSALFWHIFEILNLFTQNWNYIGADNLGSIKYIFKLISFSTVLPALFETTSLIKSIHLFDKVKLRKKYKLSKNFLFLMI